VYCIKETTSGGYKELPKSGLNVVLNSTQRIPIIIKKNWKSIFSFYLII
jgi:hypothetical protein